MATKDMPSNIGISGGLTCSYRTDYDIKEMTIARAVLRPDFLTSHYIPSRQDKPVSMTRENFCACSAGRNASPVAGRTLAFDDPEQPSSYYIKY
jgi:hypothetical protein